MTYNRGEQILLIPSGYRRGPVGGRMQTFDLYRRRDGVKAWQRRGYVKLFEFE